MNMDNEAISPSKVAQEDIKKTRNMIDATEAVLKTASPRLLEDAQKQPSSVKKVINEQVTTEPLVYLESNGYVDKLLLNEFLNKYRITKNDLIYYSSRPQELFEYVKRNNPTIDGLKIPSSGIFYIR
jgi:hypothetical protein